jgi:hypothetical protein
MALTDVQARTAKPGEKPYKLSDGGWLFLLVKPSGSKLWRMAYRVAGKEKLLSLGAYPQLSLKDARTKRDEAKALPVAGIDPGEQEKQDKIATAATQTNTLSQIAVELLEKKRSEGKAEATFSKFEWLNNGQASAAGRSQRQSGRRLNRSGCLSSSRAEAGFNGWTMAQRRAHGQPNSLSSSRELGPYATFETLRFGGKAF